MPAVYITTHKMQSYLNDEIVCLFVVSTWSDSNNGKSKWFVLTFNSV